MSSTDLVILGIVLEKPWSAYNIQKNVEYYRFSRWTKVSVPFIYRRILQLGEKGHLQSDIVKGDKFAGKAIYSITDQGRACFKELMTSCAAGPVPLLFDFNVAITNLDKIDKTGALELISALRRGIQSSAESNKGYTREFAGIPLVGRTVFEQQQLLYRALLEWLDHSEGQFLEEWIQAPKVVWPSYLKLRFGSVSTKERITVSTRYAKSLLAQSPKITRSMSFYWRIGTSWSSVPRSRPKWS